MAFLASLLWIFDMFGSKLNGIFPNLPESPKHNILGPVYWHSLSGVAQWYFVAFLALLLWILDRFGSKFNGIIPKPACIAIFCEYNFRCFPVVMATNTWPKTIPFQILRNGACESLYLSCQYYCKDTCSVGATGKTVLSRYILAAPCIFVSDVMWHEVAYVHCTSCHRYF